MKFNLLIRLTEIDFYRIILVYYMSCKNNFIRIVVRNSEFLKYFERLPI